MAQGRKLTETTIASATVPPGKSQAFLWDASVIGFGVRILPGGSKIFWFQYRPPGGRGVSARMVRIGAWPTVSLNDARKAARDLAGRIARGDDPAAERQAAQRHQQVTLRALLGENGPYQHELARRQIVNAQTAMSSLRRGLARLMGSAIGTVTRADLVGAIAAIEHDGRPGAAADLRKFARVFLEWCVGSGLITANPLAGLRRPMRSRAERLKAGRSSGRALGDDEIQALWAAAGDARFGSFGGLVRLALLTGLRRGELAQLRRRDILADRIVVQPEHAKTGNIHAVPLTALMRQVIAAAPVTSSKLLFPSPVIGGRLRGWTPLVKRLRAASGVQFRLHDLRRTCRTLMSRLGVPEDAAELAIGHARADLIARYNKDESWDARYDAVDKVSGHVAGLIGRKDRKIVALGRPLHPQGIG